MNPWPPLVQRPYALAAARALVAHSNLDALSIAKEAMKIASSICRLHERAHRGPRNRGKGIGMDKALEVRDPHMKVFTPREIVSELDKYIVGQNNAKRSVAIALRNRWRRQQVPRDLRDEIAPQEHHHDRPHRCGENGDCEKAGKAGQFAVSQDRSHESSPRSGMWAEMWSP